MTSSSDLHHVFNGDIPVALNFLLLSHTHFAITIIGRDDHRYVDVSVWRKDVELLRDEKGILRLRIVPGNYQHRPFSWFRVNHATRAGDGVEIIALEVTSDVLNRPYSEFFQIARQRILLEKRARSINKTCLPCLQRAIGIKGLPVTS